jgi:hypothetical protein
MADMRAHYERMTADLEAMQRKINGQEIDKNCVRCKNVR